MKTTAVASWMDSALAHFDYQGLEWMHQLATNTDSSLVAGLGLFNVLAEKGIAFFLLGFVLLLIPSKRIVGFRIYGAVGTASSITLMLKPLIGRLRPFMNTASDFASWHRYIGAPLEESFAFPSGHTTVMMAGMTALFLSTTNRWRGFLFLPVIFTGLYRCYTMVHYPSDILGGIIVGALGAVIGYWGVNQAQKILRGLNR